MPYLYCHSSYRRSETISPTTKIIPQALVYVWPNNWSILSNENLSIHIKKEQKNKGNKIRPIEWVAEINDLKSCLRGSLLCCIREWNNFPHSFSGEKDAILQQREEIYRKLMNDRCNQYIMWIHWIRESNSHYGDEKAHGKKERKKGHLAGISEFL